MKTINDVKAGAKRLRAYLSDRSITLSHSETLEALAKTAGYRDWNTWSAMLSTDRPFDLQLGDRVKGSFADQKLDGTVTGLQAINPKPKYAPDAVKVKIKFDTPVDVVSSEHMQGLRSYMWLYLDTSGHTIDRLGRADGKGCFRLAP